MVFLGLPIWAVVSLVAGCAGVLAVLHLLRIRRPRVRVVTTLFWSEAVEVVPARSLLQRFHHPWTYALLTLIAALLVLALGRPELTGMGGARTSRVVVLDAGMSLAAPAEGGPVRLDAAKRAVLNEIGGLRARDEVAVVVADPRPRVVLAQDEPRVLLRARLGQLVPATQPADRAAAVRLAAALARGRENSEVLLVTDRALGPDEQAGMAADVPMRTAYVGAPASNAAVLNVTFQPQDANPLRGTVRVRAGYWGLAAGSVAVRVMRGDEQLLAAASDALTRGQTRDFDVPDVAADGGELVVTVTTPDAVAADNEARFRLPRRRPIRVALDGGEPEALRILLGSDAAVRLVGADAEHDIRFGRGEAGTGNDGKPALVLHTGGGVQAGTMVRLPVNSDFARDLTLVDAICGEGAALGAHGGGTILLRADDDRVLALLDDAAREPRLVLSDALFTADATVAREPAFAILITRAVRRLAGWSDAPVMLPSSRLERDPRGVDVLAARDALQTINGSREASDVAAVPAADATQAATAAGSAWSLSIFQVCLLAALALLTLDVVLHLRGRIV